jgi:hypothetical protein
MSGLPTITKGKAWRYDQVNVPQNQSEGSKSTTEHCHVVDSSRVDEAVNQP